MSDRGSEEIIIFSGKLQRYNCICTRNKKENKDKRLEYPVTPISEEKKSVVSRINKNLITEGPSFIYVMHLP